MLYCSFICLCSINNITFYCLVCFLWYPFDVARYLYIPSMCCLYYLSFCRFVLYVWLFVFLWYIWREYVLNLKIPPLCYCSIVMPLCYYSIIILKILWTTKLFYSRCGINHLWILKNSKELLDNLKSRSFFSN